MLKDWPVDRRDAPGRLGKMRAITASARQRKETTMSETIQRTALITGSSHGLGLALARGLAGRGWSLLVDARGAAALEAAQRALSRQTRVTAIAGDVTDPAHRRDLAAAARSLGGLDAVVNNAGILGPSPQPSLLE